MDASSPPETIDHQRRRLLGMAAIGGAAAGAASLLTSRLTAARDAIRPFRIDVPEEALIDLRRRAWRRPAGPTGKRSRTSRRACSSRRCRRLPPSAVIQRRKSK
jgi:hypothetical protein